MMNLELGLGLAGFRRDGSNGVHADNSYGPDLMACIFRASADDDGDQQNNVFLDQQLGCRLPPGWEQCLDLKSGVVFYKNLSTGSTTHVDPRTALGALECNSGGYSASSRSPWKNQNTLIQTNSNLKASEHGSSECGYGCGYDNTFPQAISNRSSCESAFMNVDLDLRLSSSLHINHISQPTSPSSSSSRASAYTLHMEYSQHSHSCISDAMQRQGLSTVNHVHIAEHSKWSGSVLSSTSSPAASAVISGRRKCALEDSDSEIDNEDASTPMTTAACMRCLMFVLISSSKNEAMRCPLCGCEAVKPLDCL